LFTVIKIYVNYNLHYAAKGAEKYAYTPTRVKFQAKIRNFIKFARKTKIPKPLRRQKAF
jgi:hypothetical protein